MKNEELILSYQQGDKQALESLIENNRGIINKIVNKFYIGKTNSIDRDDLEQEGIIGLLIAAQKYNSNRENKANFITYAFYWIYQRINRFIRTRNTNDETSLNVPVGEEEDAELLDMVDSHDNSMEIVEDEIYFKQLRNELEEAMISSNTLTEIEVLKLRYGWDIEPMTIKEIGEMLNIPEGKTSLIETKALRKMHNSVWGRTRGKKYRDEIIGPYDCSYASVEKKFDEELKSLYAI